ANHDDFYHSSRRDPRLGQTAGNGRVARSHVGVRPVIQAEASTLRSFQKYPLLPRECIIENISGIAKIWFEVRNISGQGRSRGLPAHYATSGGGPDALSRRSNGGDEFSLIDLILFGDHHCLRVDAQPFCIDSAIGNLS